MTKERYKKIQGFSAKALILPAIIIIFALNAFVVMRTFLIDGLNSKTMASYENYLEYTRAADDLQNASNTLTDNARLYVSTGTMAFIDAYFKEYSNEEKGKNREKAVETLKKSNNTSAVRSLEQALETSNLLVYTELKAMKLRAVADFGYSVDLSAYPELDAIELDAKYASSTAQDKRTDARELVNGEEYGAKKTLITEYTAQARDLILEATNGEYNEYSRRMKNSLMMQFVLVILLSIIIIIVFALLLLSLILPLTDNVTKIENGEKLQENVGLKEIRLLATSYNELLKNKNLLEQNLRNLAHTDALTGLPNRLAFTHILAGDFEDKKITGSAAFFSFDVNDLKLINDTGGHLQGDNLLRSAAKCILDCFGNDKGDNCFRFGGDEFAAFLSPVSVNEIAARMERFELIQAQNNIRIACGYAFSEDMSDVTPQELFKQADDRMYEQKMQMKKHPS